MLMVNEVRVQWLCSGGQQVLSVHGRVFQAHRLKITEIQLCDALPGFTPATKVLITGTPLQINVKDRLEGYVCCSVR